MELLAILLILSGSYIAAVEIVRIFAKDEDGNSLTRQAAAARVRKAIGSYIKDNVNPDNNNLHEWWGILPGMNAAGEIIPADVEAAFPRLLGAFETAYLQNHFWHSKNVYAYVFVVYGFKADITDELAISDYLTKLAEADIQTWIHRLYPRASFPRLVAVTLYGSTLTVYIAQNGDGVMEVAAIRDSIRRSIAADNIPQNPPDIEV